MNTDIAALGTILGIWAHPDDEAYLSGGLMALARANGQRVVCVTATRGELGTTAPVAWPPERLAAERTRELADCLNVLGVHEHHWLDYRDGGCAAADAPAAIRRLAELVAQVRPDTVLTFGPDGMTGHDDHISVSRWTASAFGRVAKDGATLHYATNTPTWLARYREPLDAHNVFMGAEPPCTPADELSIGETFTGELLDTKLGAIRSMTSQVEPLVNALGEDFFREGMAEEAFRRA